MMYLACVVGFLFWSWLMWNIGRASFAGFVWNLLASNRSRNMATSVLLYCAAESPQIRIVNKWRNVTDAYEGLKSGKDVEELGR